MNELQQVIIDFIEREQVFELMSEWIPVLQWDLNDNLGANTKLLLSEFNLIKDSPTDNFAFIALPPELTSKYRGIDFRNIAKMKFGEGIKNFIQVMIDNFPSKNLIMLYNNVNELRIKTTNFDINRKVQLTKKFITHKSLDEFTVASYSPRENRITIPKGDKTHALNHELFHMATSYIDKERGTKYCGFEQSTSFANTIGTGMNEGYTELMTSNYFPDDSTGTSKKYFFLKIIMEHLEKIVGKEMMENFYLNADLNGLVNEMANYEEYENVQSFVQAMDFLYHNLDSKFIKFESNRKLLVNNMTFIHQFLIKLLVNKTMNKVENNEITIDEAKQIVYQDMVYLVYTVVGDQYLESEISHDQLDEIVYSKFKNEDVKN